MLGYGFFDILISSAVHEAFMDFFHSFESMWECNVNHLITAFGDVSFEPLEVIDRFYTSETSEVTVESFIIFLSTWSAVAKLRATKSPEAPDPLMQLQDRIMQILKEERKAVEEDATPGTTKLQVKLPFFSIFAQKKCK